MLDKYSDTGKLSQIFPLSQGSVGNVSPLLKNIFPNLNEADRDIIRSLSINNENVLIEFNND